MKVCVDITTEEASSFLTNLENKIMPRLDELSGKIDGLDSAIADFQTTITGVITSEHDQVAAALADLQSQIGNSDVDEAELAAITAKVDAVKDRLTAAKEAVTTAIQGVFEPATIPTPTPAPDPTTEPAVNPDEPPPAPELPGDVTPPV